MPVNWNAVVGQAETSTNYQLLPGDRVFVAAQPMVQFDTKLGRAVAPFERLLGIILLGSSTARSFGNNNNNNNNNNTGGF